MLKYFGSATCPRCDSGLVHEYAYASDWMLSSEVPKEDQRWLCPSCGFSRPVIYAVERSATRRESGRSGLRYTA